MNRREFIASCVGMALAPYLPKPAPKPKPYPFLAKKAVMSIAPSGMGPFMHMKSSYGITWEECETPFGTVRRKKHPIGAYIYERRPLK